MRRISYITYPKLISGRRTAFHSPFGWMLAVVLFIVSASLTPKTMEIAADPSLIRIVEELKAETGLPWHWRPLSLKSDAYRIIIRRNIGEQPAGWVLGRVPLFPAVHRWNPIQTITPSDLDRLQKGKITDWAQLGGEAHSIHAVSGRSTVRRLIEDSWSFGWVYWPQLTPQIKALHIQGTRFPWRGGPDGKSLFGWAILEPPPAKQWGSYFSRKLRDFVVGRAIRKHFNGGRWLYGEKRAVLTVVGDILFDRGITETAWDKYHNYAYVFGPTVHVLRSADLVMGNLECPLNRTGWPINMFTGDPRAIGAIRYGGFDILSLANNHILDCGTRGLMETVDLLEKHGLKTVGAGADRDEARNFRLAVIRGIRIAVLAYTEVRRGFTYTRIPLEWRAGPNRPGVNFFDMAAVREDLARARRMADIVVVLAHWGDEYHYEPNLFQRRMVQEMFKAGADLIVGHHPHVIQGVAFGSRGIAAYSLGNFVFDQYSRPCREGLILEALVNRHKVLQVRFRPVLIEAERPQLLEGAAAGGILRKLRTLSQGLNEDSGKGRLGYESDGDR